MDMKTTSPLQEMHTLRLHEMNTVLANLKLPLLLRTGNYKNGETELVSITRYERNPFYAVVQFEAILPDGKTVQLYLQYGTGTDEQNPCVVIPIVNGTHAVMVSSHRPAALARKRSWFTEFPRGFVATGLQPTILDKKMAAGSPKDISLMPLRILGRKLHALFLREDVRIDTFQRIDGTNDGIFQDTGRSGDALTHWLVRLSTPDIIRLRTEVKGPKQMRIELVPVEELKTSSARNARNICGEIDLAAILLWREEEERHI